MSHAHGHQHGAGSRRALAVALAFTVAYGVVQLGASALFHSLALAADAVHNVSDGAAIAIALAAAWAAGLPARGARTYGWRRAEILAALINGLALVAISIWILVEAYARLQNPPEVAGLGVLVVGAVGIVANGIPVVLMLRAGSRRDLNVRAALTHAASDVLGSAGAALAGLIVLLTGWEYADPLVGAIIGLAVLASSLSVIREALRILMEVAPGECSPDVIGPVLAGVEGVREVHDLHVWTITSGFPALSAHVVTREGADQDRILHQLRDLLRARFGITHSTLQLDRAHDALLQIHRPGCPEAPAHAGGGRPSSR